MPIVIVHTNLQNEDIPSDFEARTTYKIGEVLNKTVDRIHIIVEAGKRMCKNLDSESPMCIIEIHSIKVFDPEKNPGYTEKLLPFFTSLLGVPKDRISLLYLPRDPDYMGMTW